MSVAKGEKIGLLDRVKKLFRGVSSEMKKVHWPNRKELGTYTVVVIIVVAIIGVVIWLIDLGIASLVKLLL